MNDQRMFDSLKDVLLALGNGAVRDFLGYGPPAGEDRAALSARLDEAYMQMPDDVFEKYIKKYMA